jgi:aminopeptidase N
VAHSTARRAAPTFLLGATLTVTACGDPPPPPPPEAAEGVAWTLAEQRKATVADPRYDVRFSVPRERTSPLRGRVEIRFTWDDGAARPVILDFREPERRVLEVRVNGRVVRPWTAANHLLLAPEELVQGEENLVEVAFLAGDLSLNRNEDFLYTLFVPDRAHAALPLFDQPNLKGRWTLALEIPAEWTALANGELVEEREGGALLGEWSFGRRGREAPSDPDHGGSRKVLHFGETEPIPTYLFAFAAGDFQVERAERGGRTLTFLHRESDAEKVARNLPAIFDLHHTALRWLEEYTGIDYPFGPFGFVAVPSFQYGGMEHPGAIFYRASSLFLEPSATQAQELSRASLIAHETAHMWFGDLVTMDWFDDVWTKEVFANFMAAKIVHPSFPDVDHDLRFLLAHHPTAYGVDRTAGANPIRQPLENLIEAGTLYGPIIYQKAPIVMQQLERMVGEATLQEGLRDYLSVFAYDNATWPDLITILDGLTPDDLAAWSRVWVEEPGRPAIRAELRGDRVLQEVVLRQEDPRGEGRRWPQALQVILGYGTDRAYPYPALLEADSSTVAGVAGRPLPDYVLPNGSGVEYGLFRLDRRSMSFLSARLPELDDPLLRGTGWVTLWDAVLEGELGAGDFLDLLLRGVEMEGEQQNLQRILGMLDTTFWLLLPPEERVRVAARVEEALWTRLDASGGGSVGSAIFRAFRGVALTPEGVGRLRRVWEGEEEVPGVTLGEEDRIALASALALRQVTGWAGILDRQAGEVSDPDRRARMTFVRPALDADPTVREAFFETLKDPANRGREPWVLEALGYLHHPLREGHGERFIRPALDLLGEIQRTGDIFFPAGWVSATLSDHPTATAVAATRTFLESRPDLPPRLREKVLQSLDLPQRAVRIRRGEAPRRDGG